MTPGHPIRFRPTGLLAWVRERWCRFVAARAAARETKAREEASYRDYVERGIASGHLRGLDLPPPDPELRNPIGKDGVLPRPLAPTGLPMSDEERARVRRPPATPVPGPGRRRWS